MFKIRHLWLILGVLGMLLLSCKDTSEHKGATDQTTKTKHKSDAYATIHLDDGSTIDLDVRRQSGKVSSSTSLTANLSDYGLIVMLRLKTHDQPIKEKDYTNPEADMTIKNVTKDGPLDEEYRSYYYTDADGNEGSTKITITELSEDHSEGSFSGTLYSKSHRKMTVEGKFNTKKK